jgi:hypothetical protein
MHALVDSFRGEAPLVTPRALPNSAAAAAVNARLLTGDLTAWRQFARTEVLENTGPVQSIFLLDTGVWLSWDDQVDVARGVIPGDTTRRTYITGLDVPRFTTLAMATSGARPWPTQTRALGVPAPGPEPLLTVGVDPNATTFAVDVFDAGDALTANWVTSPAVSSGGVLSVVSQSASVGAPASAYELRVQNNVSATAYAHRNFGMGSASVAQMSLDVSISNESGAGTNIALLVALGTSESGSGVAFGISDNNGNAAGGQVLAVYSQTSWTSRSVLASIPISDLTLGAWYTLTCSRTLNTDNTYTVSVSLYAGSALVTTVAQTGSFTIGDFCGILGDTGSSNNRSYFFDNIHVQASGATGYAPAQLATSYVYVFVNDLGEESAPSPASVTIQRTDGIVVTVATATELSSGYDNADWVVQTKRIYRAVTGTTGTAFQFVAEIPLAQATYDDTLSDSQTGDVLPSDNWALPPSDLRGILALPNGIMVGFRRNQLCFSAQNQPHAWPVEYRLNTDTDIVGIGNVDNTVVIGTESFLYVATGNDPAAYSMSKFEVPYACSSKRSFAYLTGVGVVFAGPDGLMACAGPGQVRNLTDQTLFTRRQWQDLDPGSMLGVSHNDIYFLFFESTARGPGCYAVDTRTNGFGVVEFSFHASSAHVDPIEDKMYLVLDHDAAPTDLLLADPGGLGHPADGKTIFEFEGDDEATPMVFSWTSKLWFMPRPTVMQIAQVRSPTDDYSNLVALFHGDGELVDALAIEGEVVFTLAEASKYTTFQMTLIGTSPVSVFQAGEQVQELA